MKSRLLGVFVLAAVVLLAIAAGASNAGKKASPITLTMWSYDNQDPGLQPVLQQLSKDFEKSHPGVKINIVFKDFNSLVGTVPRALASGSGPDVTEGNQGYQTDAQLVKAKLILPLTKYVKKYGWDKLYAPSTWGMFRWTPDGKSFGKGPVWGIAQTGQNVVAFYNKRKLRALGFNPNKMPQTFAGFDRLLAQLRAKLPDDEPVIEHGNKEGYGFIHLFGGIQGAYVKAQSVRNWIYHVPGSRYDTPGTIRALGQAPAVGQGRLLQRRLQRARLRRLRDGVRQGQGRLLDRRGLGLDDHQDRPRRGERRRDAGPARAERHVDVDRRPLRPVAHLGEDEVPGPRRRVAQLRDHVPARQDADVLAAADPGRPAREGARR